MSAAAGLPARDGARWTRTDSAWILSLAAVAVVARWLFHTRYAYSWDTANFVLATGQMDLRLDLPHPMGYIVWVWMGRLGSLLGLEVHQALVAWNWLAAAIGTSLLYRLGLDLWDRRTAIVAALLFVTSPVTWFYGGVAYADIWDATLGAGVAWHAWRQKQSPSLAAAAWATLLYACAAGIRQQNLLFLMPLWLWALSPLRWPGRLLMGGLAVALCASWAVPLMRAAGGAVGYLEVLHHHSQRGFEGYSWSSWRQALATFKAARYILDGVLLGCFLFLAAAPFYLYHTRRERPWVEWWNRPRARLLILWAAPPALFLLVVHLDVRPGLTLGLLPPVILATAAACSQVVVPAGRILSESTWVRLAGIGVALNLIFFLASPLATSRAEMVTHDRRLESEYAAIRERFSPEDTLLISDTNWYWYSARQAALYLPEYEVWYIDEPTGRQWWGMRGHRSWNLTQLQIPDRIRYLVFIHDHRQHADGRAVEVDVDLVRRDPLTAGTYLCWMPLDPSQHDLIYTAAWHGPHPRGVAVRPRPAPGVG
jgi:hypothetical protein